MTEHLRQMIPAESGWRVVWDADLGVNYWKIERTLKARATEEEG